MGIQQGWQTRDDYWLGQGRPRCPGHLTEGMVHLQLFLQLVNLVVGQLQHVGLGPSRPKELRVTLSPFSAVLWDTIQYADRVSGAITVSWRKWARTQVLGLKTSHPRTP